MEHARVIRSAGLVGAMTLVSRGMGFVRDILMAGVFGTSTAMSAFVVAFRIPNLFRALFGEGALSAAFIPVFIETRHREGDEAAWRLGRQVFTGVAIVLGVLAAAGIVGCSLAELWPGLSEKWSRILSLTRIMLPYMVFICLAAVSMAALNSFHHFLVPAATPWILNAVLIAAVLVSPRFGAAQEERIYVVAWGVLAAGVLQWAAQIPVLRRYGFTPRPLLAWRDERLRRMLALMGPAAIGRAVTQVNVMIDTLLAAAIPGSVAAQTWAPAALYFSERLIYLPMGIFATALSTVLLPTFSRQAAEGDHDAVRRTVGQSLRLLLFVMVPAAVGLLALGGPIVRTCMQWRSFTEESTLLTARALAFYAPGMVAFSLGKVFVPAFYALQDPKTPVRVGVVTVALNIVLSIAFMLTWPLYWKHAGIAFATVVAETVNGVALARILHRRLGSPGWGAIAASVARFGVASLALAAAAIAAEGRLIGVFAAAGAAPKIAQVSALLAGVLAGAAAYVLAARLLRCPELRELGEAIARRRSPGPAAPKP